MSLIAGALGWALLKTGPGDIGWMPSDPGPAKFVTGKEALVLSNGAIEARFASIKGKAGLIDVRNHWDAIEPLVVEEPFQLEFRDGRHVVASQMKPVQAMHNIHGLNSETVEGTLMDTSSGTLVHWRTILNDGANYIRQEVTLTASTDADVSVVTLGQGSAGAKVSGNVPGSPVIVPGYFAGLEHPMSEAKAENGWSVGIARKLPIKKGQSITYSSVFGVAPRAQMRRAILNYMERERPRKYAPFLHYNSWYDLGYFTKYTADQCVERINTFGEELGKKRHVPLKSFLFDDGWDDTSTLWEFHSGFPNGFKPLKTAAEAFGADPGIWLSPWGGYGGPRGERLATGKKLGYEIDSQGYALSGPKYYQRFHDVTLDLVKNHGINQFKFDGTGSPDKQYPGSQFSSDFEAAIALIHDLREAKPGLFINLTTGTWPSPFWTKYADSIWRGGSDHSFAGVGPKREQWITYRDGDTYHGIVQRGPMFPLTSLMLHGIIYAQHAHDLNTDPMDDFRNEVRSYFATGTQLQEMYITPSLLTRQNWDDLAEAALWSSDNRETMVDTHWVGGDPNNLEVYGWAAWTPKKAILTLRNPSDRSQAFSIYPPSIFELPAELRGRFVGQDPFIKGRQTPLEIPYGASKVVILKPFEVRVIEGTVR